MKSEFREIKSTLFECDRMWMWQTQASKAMKAKVQEWFENEKHTCFKFHQINLMVSWYLIHHGTSKSGKLSFKQTM